MRQKYSQEFYRKEFEGASFKDAYLKACKWYATNIISTDEFEGVQVEFEKGPSKEFPSVIIHLFVTVDENKLKNEHCQVCREAHRLFYMNDINCQNCNVAGYQRRSKSILDVRKEFYKEKLKQKCYE